VNKSVRPVEKPDPEEKPTPEEKPKPGGDYLVGASTWAKGEIQLATEVGLTFDSILNNYQKNITRAEFCKLAVNFHKSMGGEIPAVDQSPFTDTDDDDVLVANKLGIVNGTSATTFNPNADITREQIAAMMMRAIKKFDEPKVSNDLTKFADYKKISSYAVESLSYLNQEGIIKGLSAAEIAPLENTTREQASLIVYRTYTSLEPGSSPSTDSKSGTYKIVTATNSTNCIGVAGGSKANGTQLITWANVAAVSDQKFKIEPVGTKYSIKAVHSGKALAPSGAQKNGTKIVQKTYDGSAAQLYDIVDVGDGYVNFVSSDGYCISVSGGNTNQGVHIILWEKTGNTSQKFQLEKVN
ncbi:MAG: RICIN domain-containing protein, partial [Oscillibacter sp.]